MLLMQVTLANHVVGDKGAIDIAKYIGMNDNVHKLCVDTRARFPVLCTTLYKSGRCLQNSQCKTLLSDSIYPFALWE